MLTSCATTGISLQQFDDPADICNASRQILIQTETDLKKWAFGGAMAGAAAGVGVAALTGGDSDDILLGVLIGSVLGGTAGYLAGRRKTTNDRAELLAAIDNDAASDSKRVHEIKTAVKTLGKCRRDQIKTVRQQFEGGTLSKEAALARAKSIQAAADKDNELITCVLGRVDKRYNTYIDTKAEVLEVERQQVVAASPAKADSKLAEFDLVPAVGRFRIKRNANVRKGPSVNTLKLAVLKTGETIEVEGHTQSQEWYGFIYKDQPAFVYTSLIEKLDSVTSNDPLRNLAEETNEAKEIQQVNQEQTDHDMEALKILLS